jgi:hypothetical protein
VNIAELNVMKSGSATVGISPWRDLLGIVASIGCAIHCAAMPFIISYLPALGLSFLADESFHKWMALACFLIAIVAFIPGLRKHGNWLPVSIGAGGLAMITFAAFGFAGECCPSCAAQTTNEERGINSFALVSTDVGCEHCEDCTALAETTDDSTLTAGAAGDEPKHQLSMLAPWITPFGGLILVSAHLLNRRYGCLCGCC